MFSCLPIEIIIFNFKKSVTYKATYTCMHIVAMEDKVTLQRGRVAERSLSKGCIKRRQGLIGLLCHVTRRVGSGPIGPSHQGQPLSTTTNCLTSISTLSIRTLLAHYNIYIVIPLNSKSYHHYSDQNL